MTLLLPSRQDIAARLSDPEYLARVGATAHDDAEDWSQRPGGPVPAAVLVPIIWHETGPGVLLTLRSARLSAHAGQVAFPGGRIEPGETAEEAALREAAEEVGLDPRQPVIAATLPDHMTGTGYRVTPVVAFLDPPVILTPDPSEVQLVFELPLALLFDPAAPTRRSTQWRGRMRDYWVWPHAEHLIWGATATILMNLARVLRQSEPAR
ncbi:CoA pyrophosphatase [Roseomonas frigidaquae]|uniref:CoA pyrophosphatase n=1 Tax=Falsiroseomonas frigidaquae TaxID=487318 RepID=A0ABX1EUR5_9PROT|nr:CoA pyrophosphatase [Falsiroseomonas frigidaquae]